MKEKEEKIRELLGKIETHVFRGIDLSEKVRDYLYKILCTLHSPEELEKLKETDVYKNTESVIFHWDGDRWEDLFKKYNLMDQYSIKFCPRYINDPNYKSREILFGPFNRVDKHLVENGEAFYFLEKYYDDPYFHLIRDIKVWSPEKWAEGLHLISEEESTFSEIL